MLILEEIKKKKRDKMMHLAKNRNIIQSNIHLIENFPEKRRAQTEKHVYLKNSFLYCIQLK
jgi:hypothetical protein